MIRLELLQEPSAIPPVKGPAGGSRLLRIFLAFSLCVVLVPACARKQVYIPPEYSAPPPQQAPYGGPVRPAPPQSPGISETPQFKKRDIPASPAPALPVQPQTPARPATPQPAPQPAQKAAVTKPKASKAQKGEATKSPQRQASMQLASQAKAPLDRGKPDTAIPLLEKAIQIDPKNGEAFMLLAKAWRQKGARKKAVEFAKKAELLFQGQPARLKEVYLLESELYRELGENTKAGQYRRKASGVRPKRVE